MKCQICGSCTVPIAEEIRWCQTCGTLLLLRGCTPLLSFVARWTAERDEVVELREESLKGPDAVLADQDEVAEMAQNWAAKNGGKS